MSEAEKMESPRPATYIDLAGAADSRDAAVKLAQAARRSLVIFTRDLEPSVYDDRNFLEACKQLVLGTRFAKIRVLCVDITRATREGSRMLEMAQRLSSFIEIRKPHPDYADLAEAFLICDEAGILYRKQADRWEGFADPSDAAQAREKLKLFDTIWSRSEPDPNSRRIKI